MRRLNPSQKCAEVATYYKFMSLCDFNKEELLVDRESLGQKPYNCLICQQLLRRPVHCVRCKSEFCRSCATRWARLSDVCPLRCSSPWILDESPSKNLLLKCPLDESCFPLSPECFELHIKDCERNQLIRDYRCSHHHPLSYMSVPKLMGCADCGSITAVRSICFECRELGQTFLYYYCQKCRKLKISKQECPQHHKFVHIIPSGGFTCEGCHQTSSKKERCFLDRQCDMAFCDCCYQKLPDKLNLTTL